MGDAFNAVIIGDASVGKTALNWRLIRNKFFDDDWYSTTAATSNSVCVHHTNGAVFNVNLIDTGGQEEFEGLRTQYLYRADTIILAFCVASEGNTRAKVSFDNILKKVLT